ncbi:HEAT repeat domain-containing protein [Neobacillus sp. LXY-1]|uniref:HEAT repeat domain-containing protein n=1 Tax=Neobacillus sp. LXY-1 TaxID=3379133 RepID=UPI003EE37757
MFKNELLFLSILTVSSLSTLIFLLLYLILRKMIVNRKRAKINELKEKYNPVLFNVLTNGGNFSGLTSTTHLQLIAIEELLSKYSKITEGIEEKEQLANIAEYFLSDYFRRQLKSKRWSIRMNMLHQIEDLYMVSFLKDISIFINKKRQTHDELVQALRVLASFDYPELLELLTSKFSNLSEYEYRNILIRASSQQFNQFVLHFHRSSKPLKRAILEVISIKKEKRYIVFLEDIFSKYDGEVKLRALKAIANIGYVQYVDPFLELLYSPKWEERMVSVKLIGQIQEEKGIPRLLELLQDPSWWVRSQAGQAISRFTQGKELLEQVLLTSQDPFAKDMAFEWLNKGE